MKDPLTSDLYSTAAAGVTAAVSGSQGLDAPVTVYRGGQQYDALPSSPGWTVGVRLGVVAPRPAWA